MAVRPDEMPPGGSETPQDPSFQRDPAPVQIQGELELWMRYYSGHEQQDPNERESPRGNPKRATGLHPTIRATSTDDDALSVPAPRHDDPVDDTPGEAENPQNDFEDDDFIEDLMHEDETQR
jgi:hypothetical protein